MKTPSSIATRHIIRRRDTTKWYSEKRINTAAREEMREILTVKASVDRLLGHAPAMSEKK